MPPHVTVLSPFIDAEAIDGGVTATVAEIVASLPAFEVAFDAVRRWPPSDLGPGVVWLKTEAIGAVRHAHPAQFDAVETEASRLVPFRRRATAVALVVEGPGGRWRTRRRFALG